MLRLITADAALYAGIDVLSIIIILCLATLSWLYRKNVGNYIRVNIKALVVFYIVYLVADIVWICVGDADGVSLGLKYLVNAVYFAALGFAAFFWFRNVCEELRYTQVLKKCSHILSAVPLAVLLILAFSAQYNNYMFIVDPIQGYSQGPWFGVFIAIHYGYIIIASLIALYHIIRKRSNNLDFWILAIYCVPIILAGFLQIAFGGNYQAVGFTTSLCIIFLYKILYDSVVTIRVIQSVTSEYSCVYLCDPSLNVITPYRVDKGFYSSSGEETRFDKHFAKMPYDTFLEIFLENYVIRINLEEMTQILQPDYIINCLADEGKFEKLYINEKGRYCSVHLSLVEEGESMFVLGIADRDDEIRKEMALKRGLIEAKRLANTDALTGVRSASSYVRRTAELDKRIADGTINKFAIVGCDLNNLKDVNDACGHDIGDIYIKNSALVICSIFKNSPVFRTGGDEFVIILEGQDYENRIVLTEHLKHQVTVPKEAPETLSANPSIAVGMSKFHPGEDKSCLDVFRRADTDMYKNKFISKNGNSRNADLKASYMPHR